MEIKIKKKDQRYKEPLKIGKTYDLPDRVADRIITKGCGEVVESKPKSKPKRKRKKNFESNFRQEEKSTSPEIQEG
jgi:hypothetical protein